MTSDAIAAEPVAEDKEIAGWAIVAARAADDKLAFNTLILDVGDVMAITDIFVITAGSNPRQVRAIANNIEQEIARTGGPKPLRREGNDTFEWVLIDFGGFICHVFIEEHRAFYELERLWGDRPRLEWAPNESTGDRPISDGREPVEDE